MKAIYLIGTLVLVFTIAACSTEPEIVVQGVRFTQERLDEGRLIYSEYCASCHGSSAEGQFPDTPNQPDETGRLGAPPHNGNGHTWHHGDALLIRYVREGGVSLRDPENFYPMPAFGDQLSEDQIMTILAYIKTLWSNEQRTRQQQITESGG